MNAESLGTYQRPLQVFKYMHIHEYMKGRSQYTPTGLLGSGAQVRDGKRALYIGTRQEDAEEATRRNRSRVRTFWAGDCSKIWNRILISNHVGRKAQVSLKEPDRPMLRMNQLRSLDRSMKKTFWTKVTSSGKLSEGSGVEREKKGNWRTASASLSGTPKEAWDTRT